MSIIPDSVINKIATVVQSKLESAALNDNPVRDKPFWEWNLSTWANVLEVVGTGIAIATFILGLIIGARLRNFRRRVLFDKTVARHLTSLTNIRSNLNTLLNDYSSNKTAINSEIRALLAEVVIINSKLKKVDSSNIRVVRKSCNSILRRGLTDEQNIPDNKFYKPIYKIFNAGKDDIYKLYDDIGTAIRSIQEIKIKITIP